jgi:hypothetical protein
MSRLTGQAYWSWLGQYDRWPTEIAARFWAHVSVQGPDDCWMWKSGKHKYGNFSVGPRQSCKQFGAHVFAYMLAHNLMQSPVSRDGSSVIAHLCNTPRCVNPRHLIRQSQACNIQHREFSGNTARGPKHGRWNKAQRSQAAESTQPAIAS